jgi:hypothetical protein
MIMTETAQTIKDSIDVLAPYLDKLAESIGNNGTYVFNLMMKQSYITGIVDLSYLIFCIILSIVAFKCYKLQHTTSTDDADNYAVISLISMSLSTAFGVAWVCQLNECVTCLFNPEYAAIIQLLHAIK